MANIFQKLIPYRSPLELLSEHSALCVEASKIMESALKNYLDNNSVFEESKKVDTLEEKADHIKLQLRDIYGKLKWTYFNKSDFLDILHNIDSIIDLTDDVVKMLTMNTIDVIPDDVKSDILGLANVVVKSVQHMNETILKLKTVVESSFSAKEIKLEDEKVEIVEVEETSSDKVGIEIGRKLFSKKHEMNPVDIMFLNSVVILLMRIEDRAKNAAERIRIMVHS
jgi:predicted phosphate transport protein (TIGR00153 family)